MTYELIGQAQPSRRLSRSKVILFKRHCTHTHTHIADRRHHRTTTTTVGENWRYFTTTQSHEDITLTTSVIMMRRVLFTCTR